MTLWNLSNAPARVQDLASQLVASVEDFRTWPLLETLEADDDDAFRALLLRMDSRTDDELEGIQFLIREIQTEGITGSQTLGIALAWEGDRLMECCVKQRKSVTKLVQDGIEGSDEHLRALRGHPEIFRPALSQETEPGSAVLAGEWFRDGRILPHSVEVFLLIAEQAWK